MSETRLHERRIISRANGRTRAAIECPFCGCTVEVYVWSLAGSGKRCECGAVHHYHPATTMKDRTRGGTT